MLTETVAPPQNNPQAVVITAAHPQTESNKYVVYFPDHEPREGDPHYALFNSMRKRMVATGKCKCWICGTTEKLEWHHCEIEFALATGEDWQLVAQDFPNIDSEEALLEFVESEGNMLILCADHHRSPYCGIHHVDYPNWKAQKYWRKDLPPLLSSVTKTASVTTTTPDGETTTVAVSETATTITAPAPETSSEAPNAQSHDN